MPGSQSKRFLASTLACDADGIVNVPDLLAIIYHWLEASSCYTGDPLTGGFPTSIEDCINKATNFHTPYSPEWIEFVNKCVEALCEAEIINCD